MPRTLTLRLKPSQEARLERLARRLNKSCGETLGVVLEEALRSSEFFGIEFGQTAVGRVACLKGSPLAVWEVIRCWRTHQENEADTMAYLGIPAPLLRTALNYYAAYPEEIDSLLRTEESVTLEELRRRLPQLQIARC